jgi:hypothetical protein
MLAFGKALEVSESLSEDVEGVNKKTLFSLNPCKKHSGSQEHAQELAPSVSVAHLLLFVGVESFLVFIVSPNPLVALGQLGFEISDFGLWDVDLFE